MFRNGPRFKKSIQNVMIYGYILCNIMVIFALASVQRVHENERHLSHFFFFCFVLFFVSDC
jgi:hypothetical protein